MAKAKPKRYRVTSRSNTLGRPTGTEFTETLPPEFEAQLVSRGAIEVIGKPISPKQEDEVPKDVEKKRPELT